MLSDFNGLIQRDFPRSQSSVGHVQQQPSQPNAKAMNLGRYREALYSALWLQLSISSMLCARNYNVANDQS